MSRSKTERGARRSINVRKSQRSERKFLQESIHTAQDAKSKLNEEKIVLEQQLRVNKIEYGPISYIAALIYDNPNKNLDNAVRYVIILLVVVFDPLAVILLLCSQYSFEHIKKSMKKPLVKEPESYEKPLERWYPDVQEQKIETSNKVHHQTINDYEEPYDTDINSHRCNTFDLDVNEEFMEENINNNEHLSNKQVRSNWKTENPDNTLKSQEKLLEMGLINKLPWN